MSDFVDFGSLPDEVTWRGASVLAQDVRGRVLMQLRDSDAGLASPGKWGLFGGGVEPGESLDAAARREFHEETGIDIAAEALRPLARFRSQAMASGIVHVFALDRRVVREDVRLAEGAGFAFLTREQVGHFDLIEAFRTVLQAPDLW
ncbi:NUDIX hydrolase [Rhodobacteraceae bacterium D3-12]|nr:NUDIX hydrolase [Rhodobacteraceae bacterium D3-12]